MSRRTTINITDVVTKANQYLRVSKPGLREGRKMLGSFVESLLMEANAYKGFRYLAPSELQAGYEPGIIFDESEARKHVYPDDSRVAYY